MPDCLSLLLCSGELLGEVLHCVSEEAGLGHGGIQEQSLICFLQCRPDTATGGVPGPHSGHRTAQRPRHNLRRSNFWVMTTLVQVPQCLGQVNLQQRHSVWGGSSFSAGRSVRADECLQAREGSNGLPRKVEAVFGHDCIATDRSTGRTSIYPRATPSSRVAREDEPLERFLDVKGAIHVPVSSSCTFREERHWGGALRTSVGHPMKPIV